MAPMDDAKLVITFHTTTQAIAWERRCRDEGLPGRLIPMPPIISAQCGLAWLITPEEQEYLLQRAKKLGLEYDQVIEL